MSAKRKLALILAVLVSLFFLIFASLISWLNSDKLQKVCSEFLDRQTDLDITIGKIRPGLFNEIIIDKVVLKAKGEKNPLAKVRAVKIRYSWSVLLTNFEHLPQSIENITLVQPKIWLERDLEEKWNYQKLFPPGKKEGKLSQDWLTRLTIENGDIQLVDKKGTMKNSHFTKIWGWANLRDNPQIAFEVRGQEGQSRISSQGVVNIESHKLDLSIEGERISLSDWHKMLPQWSWLQIKKGIIQGKVRVKGYYPDYLSYQGRLAVLEGEVSSNQIPLPVKKIEGEMIFNPGAVSFNRLHGFLGATPVQLNGTVYLTKNTELDLDLQSPDVKVEELAAKWLTPLKQIKRADKLRLKINFLGPVNRLTAYGDFYLNSGQIAGQKVKDVQISLSYIDKDKMVNIQKASVHFQGGVLAGQGTILTNNWQYQLAVRAKGIPLTALPLGNEQFRELKGQIGGVFFLSGVGNHLERIAGKADLNKASWRKIILSEVRSEFLWEQGKLDLPYLLVQGPTISGRVWGQIDPKSGTSLKVNLPYLDLGTLASCFNPGLMVQGKGSWQGTVGIQKGKIQVKGDFFANQGKLFAQDFSELSGEISLQDDKILVDNLYFQDGTTRHYLKGQIGLKETDPLDLTLVSQEARVENLLKLVKMEKTDLHGQVESTIRLGGTIKNMQIQGEMQIEDGAWKDEALDRATAKFHWKNNQFYLDNLEAQQGDTFLRAQGSWDSKGKGQLNINAREVDLEKIPYLRYRLPAGAKTVNLLGRINFESFQQVKLNPLIIVHGRNSYRVQGNLNDLGSADPQMNVEVTVERGDLTILSAFIPTNFPHHITGQIQGKVNCWGSVNNPNTRAIINLKEGKVGEYTIDSGKMDLVWKDKALSVLRFRLEQGEGYVSVQGRVELEGKTNLNLVAEGLEGGMLSQLLLLPEKVEGKVNLTAKATGETKSPKISCSLTVTQGKFWGTNFDKLVGFATWKDGLANIQSLSLEKDKHKLVAFGTIPTNDPNREMSLEVSMKDGDLGLLTVLMNKQIDWAKGAAQAGLRVQGTLKKPLLQGEIKIDNGSIKPNVLSEPIENISAHLVFQGNGLELKYFQGTIGGGSFFASGKGEKLFTPLANLDFRLTANNLAPKSKFFQGILNGELTLTGSDVAPVLGGNITLSQGSVVMPPSMEEGKGVKSSLVLDIGVNIGDNLRVKAMVADLFLRGGIKVSGTLGNPLAEGQLTAKKGTITYLEHKFYLTKGNLVFRHINGIMPELDLEGTTRFRSTKITLRVTGLATDIKAHFESDPAMSEKEILVYLTLGHSLEGSEGKSGIKLDQEVFRLAGESIPLAFLDSFEENLGNNLGLDEFSLSQNIWKGPQITIGKSFLDEKIYVNYTVNTEMDPDQSISNQQEKWYLEAKYKLSNNLSLDYSRNNLEDNRLMLTTSIRF